MEQNLNKFISVTYQLYTVDNDEKELVEEATVENPYQFISGYGLSLEVFENEIAKLQTGDNFEFTLTEDQAYGAYLEENVLDLDKEVFYINGKFDEENISVDAIVPLMNEEGTRFMAQVLEVTDNKVKVDMNHPLAGRTLYFAGKVIESREATNEEIVAMANQLSGNGCGCGGSCSNSCGCGEEDHSCDGGCCCS